MALSDVDESPRDSTDQSTRNRSRKRRRRLLIWICIAVVLLVLVPFVNGPGFRFAGTWGVKSYAASLGLAGDLKLSGALSSGLTISQLEFTKNPSSETTLDPSMPNIQSVSVDRASLSYRLFPLINSAASLSWLDSLQVEGLAVDLILPPPSDEASRKGPPVPPQKPSDEFSPLWTILDSDISITGTDIRITDTKGCIYDIEDFSLVLPENGDSHIALNSLKLPDKPAYERASLPIQHQDQTLTLGPLSLGEDNSLKSLRISEPRPGIFTVELHAEIGGGHFVASLLESGDLEIQLQEGDQISLSTLVPESESDFPLDGELTQLTFRVENLLKAPSTWLINGRSSVSGLKWQDHQLNSVELTASNNDFSFDANGPDLALSVGANIPFATLTEEKSFEDLLISIVATLELPDLAALSTHLGLELPLEGSVSLAAQDVELTTKGTLSSGKALLQGNDISWDGLPLNLFQLAANIENPNQVVFASDARIDEQNKARIDGTISLEDLTYDVKTGVNLSVEGALRDWLNNQSSLSLEGTAELNWTGSGSLKSKELDAFHKGSASLNVSEFSLNHGIPITGGLDTSYQNTQVALDRAEIRFAEHRLSASGAWNGQSIALKDVQLVSNRRPALKLSAEFPFDPTKEEPFLSQDGVVALNSQIDDLDLGTLLQLANETPPTRGVLNGEVSASGSFNQLALSSTFDFEAEGQHEDHQPYIDLDLEFSGSVTTPQTWETDLAASLSGLTWNQLQLDSVNLDVETTQIDSRKTLGAQLTFNQSGASAIADAAIVLDGVEALEDLKTRSISADASVAVPAIEAVWKDFAPENLKNFPIEGSLAMELDKVEVINSRVESGNFSISTDSLKLMGEPVSGISALGNVASTDLIESKISVAADSLSLIEAEGHYDLSNQSYSANASATLNAADDGTLKRLLQGRHIASLLPDKTAFSLSASGRHPEEKPKGEANLEFENLSLAEGAEPISGQLEASFTESSLEAIVALTSRPLNLGGQVRWDGKRLLLEGISGESGDGGNFALTASVPLESEGLSAEPWFSSTSEMSLSAKAEKLKIGSLLDLVSNKPALTGQLDWDLDAGGTPSRPELSSSLILSDIAVPGSQEFEVGRLSLDLSTRESEASLVGMFEHAQINPLNLKASIPFHPGDWATGKRVFKDEPVSIEARMERSSLSFLATQIPAIHALDGFLALDAKVAGSISKPTVSGHGDLNLTRLRFSNRNAPSLYDLVVQTRFSDNQITIDQLNAIIAGGELNGSGTVYFNPEQEPTLNLRFAGSDVLLARTPDLSLRSDLALSIEGPWSKAGINGEIGIANSRFFKNFDLLPNALPTRNTSALPTVQKTPQGGGIAYSDLQIGVEVPPFNEWPVNVRVYTKSPFQVRSNLVESDLAADLTVMGTLGRPYPAGKLEIAEGALSLPFSSIDVEIGRVQFNQGTGFNGDLELRARAKAENYQINIFLFNRILDPQYVLTSIPPLPSEDLMTLLATGTTRQELLGSDAGSMAASKAATLLFKNMRKVSAAADREPTLLDDLQERTELEIGGINPETGEYSIAGKIRLWKRLFFVGDLDAQSDYRATLKYVFQFR